MVNLAAARDVFCIEDAKHLRPYCHCAVKGVKIYEIKVGRPDVAPLPPLSWCKEIGLFARLRCAVKGADCLSTVRVIDCFSWRPDYLIALNLDSYHLQWEIARNILVPSNGPA